MFTGNISQAINPQVNFNQQLNEAFKKAHRIVDTKSDILLRQKEEIKQNLRVLEEELKNKEADAGKIQKTWGWLKRNADWLVPTLAQVVSDGIKIGLGLP